jgi:hypothetical protein
MTHRLDVARRRDVLARWCTLAEQRLEFLTELFQSGRWRRYHSERSFLENLQEAKAAVEIWRDLLRQETEPGIAAAGISWPAPMRAMEPPPAAKLPAGVLHVHPQAPRLAIEPPPPAEPPATPSAARAPQRVVEFTLEVDGIQARYPLLRNAF